MTATKCEKSSLEVNATISDGIGKDKERDGTKPPERK
jgi:hypothetical protein